MTEGPLANGLYDVPPGKLADVVTSLEMLGAPEGRVPVARTDVRLRSERAPTVAWYRALFQRVGAPWLWTSRLLLDDGSLAGILDDPAVEVSAVEAAGVDAGLLELDFRIAGECEIAFLGLAEEMTGRGLGRWLMDHALQRAWSRPITRLWVHTCTLDHPAALPLYLRSGFVPFRRQVGIGDDPRQRGVLPADAAPHAPLL